MTDRPIIFSAPMVRALLDGRKTQTRRLIPGAPTTAGWQCDPDHTAPSRCRFVADGGTPSLPCIVRYAVGDRLYVRENIERANGEAVGFRADGSWLPNTPWRWERAMLPSIHMPREFSRLTLIVEDVKVERLQVISEHDARAEGAKREPIGVPPGCTEAFQWDHGQDTAPDYVGFGSAQSSFRHLWRSLHGTASWDANPFVVALTFRVVRKNIDEVSEAQ
ncbi:hypothetical protein [Sphingomonas nostoxanthinifaciens]|uniref:hypothetical protein n=1 Tax=Sphingomonas nostoxanthinifaciens TaxID=2872652 RepID=UPI001CC21478|nr:hypothetical protein [Sphingomonas nostoxanthinifaciens]UAK24363.1 hypothetical protein K8P63_18955 [Sphingomonas nostoxanthinifaciens]